MNEDEITNELNKTADELKRDAEKERLKLICDDLFETELGDGKVDNDVAIVPKKKKKPKIIYR